MFDTNDVYNDAVRGSTMYEDQNNNSEKSLLGSTIVATLVLVGIAYVGFNYYNVTNTFDKALVAKNEFVAEIQSKSEILVEPKLELSSEISNSEAEYLSALREIESELTEEREDVNLDTTTQMDLSLAMNDLMNDTGFASNYTKELQKEIGVELDKPIESVSVVVEKKTTRDSRTVIVKKGDTLQGISNKFYGDAMNYKRIIASNDSLHSSDTIYEGQTIILPY